MSESLPPEIPVSPPAIPPVQMGGPAPQLAPKKPGWPKVVGILGIIFGSLGVIGGANLMISPRMMEQQKEMMSTMEKTMEKDFSRHRSPGPSPKKMFSLFNKMLDTPEWFSTWCKVGGILAMLISGFYIFASIRILKIKSGAVGLFYCAAGLGVAFAMVQVVVGASMGSFMGVSVIMGGVIGGIADAVLFIVVAKGSKEMFTKPETRSQTGF